MIILNQPAKTGYANPVISVCLTLILSGTAIAQNSNQWPSFHGQDRSNKSGETGLLKEWPATGPQQLFVISGIGAGYSSVTTGGGLLFTAGQNDNQTFVYAFDMNGKPVWKMPNGPAFKITLSWAVNYVGPRSTPTYDNGRLYHLSEAGRLTAYDAKNGKELWARDIAKDFAATNAEYGYSESVLIDGNNLFVRPAGKKGFQVCINKNTGETIWANTEIPGTEGYNSMVIDEFGGYRQIVGASSNCFYGVDTKTGKLLWKVDCQNERELNMSDAIISNDNVFITSGYGKGSMLLKLTASGKEIVPKIIWQSEIMDNMHGGAILHNGYVYGSGNKSRGWFCLDMNTGKPAWNTSGQGAITFADGMIYLLDERSGIVKLVNATPEKYEVKGELKVPKGGESFYWAHPVVCGGRLYIRHGDKIFAYKVTK